MNNLYAKPFEVVITAESNTQPVEWGELELDGVVYDFSYTNDEFKLTAGEKITGEAPIFAEFWGSTTSLDQSRKMIQTIIQNNHLALLELHLSHIREWESSKDEDENKDPE